MSLLAATSEVQVSQLIGSTIEQLDISGDAFRAVELCYNDLGAHLSEADAEVYVQGSFQLGTVVRPLDGGGEYDLDLVSRIEVAKTSITQAELKGRVGRLLNDYRDNHTGKDCERPADVTEGRRSWCLHYDGFHMDVLPCIPDTNSVSSSAIELTDLNMRAWQKSDPIAYVAWFRGQCAKQFEEERIKLAKAGSVDDVPRHRVRTPLHRTVQVLKRHRDIYFGGDLDDRPPSSLITTLAARSYRGEADLLAATLGAVQRMADHVEVRAGEYWVENPACDGENFADKWNDYEIRRVKFHQWRAAVEEDLMALLSESRGVRELHERMSTMFGAPPVAAAVIELAEQANRARENGSLSMTTRGMLSTAPAAIVVPNHRFFGGVAHR